MKAVITSRISENTKNIKSKEHTLGRYKMLKETDHRPKVFV